jgi:hypothetical protein
MDSLDLYLLLQTTRKNLLLKFEALNISCKIKNSRVGALDFFSAFRAYLYVKIFNSPPASVSTINCYGFTDHGMANSSPFQPE